MMELSIITSTLQIIILYKFSWIIELLFNLTLICCALFFRGFHVLFQTMKLRIQIIFVIIYMFLLNKRGTTIHVNTIFSQFTITDIHEFKWFHIITLQLNKLFNLNHMQQNLKLYKHDTTSFWTSYKILCKFGPFLIKPSNHCPFRALAETAWSLTFLSAYLSPVHVFSCVALNLLQITCSFNDNIWAAINAAASGDMTVLQPKPTKQKKIE